jgi:peptidoglycan/LPS O-acetylase OafA/YrhL
MVGCLLAWGWENHAAWLTRFRWPLFVLGLLVYLSVLVIPGFPNSTYFRVAYLSVNAFAIGCMLPFFARLPAIGVWPQSIIAFMSKISYSLYLVHAIVLGLMLHNPILSAGHYWLNLLLYGIASIAVASITYRCIEKPVLLYRDKHFAT